MPQIGMATCDITNELGTVIQGATVGGAARFVRDPLEANALYLGDDTTAVVLVSCDLGGLEPPVNHAARVAMAEACGIPARSILIGATHTGGPSVIPTNYRKAVDEAYLARLVAWLADTAKRAVASAAPGVLRYGQGRARIGYNRRCCWANGSHTMSGDTSRNDFTGLEGPDDPTHTVLVAEDGHGRVLGLLHANTAHPCTFYGADFYSADYPGAARAYLRRALGADLPVLFFNGAQGDIATEYLLEPRRIRESADHKLARLAHLVAGETLRLMHEAPIIHDPVLAHDVEDVEVAVRLPASERLAWAEEVLAKVDAGEAPGGMAVALAHGARLLQERFGEQPRDVLPVHVVRVGGLALVTEPCELYCQYGLEIRRRSPAPLTAILGLTDGYHGYCPTPEAIQGGGYSGEPLYWARLAPDAGGRLVDAACRVVHRVWN